MFGHLFASTVRARLFREDITRQHERLPQNRTLLPVHHHRRCRLERRGRRFHQCADQLVWRCRSGPGQQFGFNLSSFRLSHLRTALDYTAGGTNTFADLQIVNCQTPFALANSTISLRNALVYDGGTNFSGVKGFLVLYY
jgi:hypothetical protein